ncbi:MAG: hypothetical protein KIT35_18575 [Piscinibacter sp.]|uniref:hypothetical protein n=1 Tax=Piscinibacter TaxID=1114981 RepID=UPI000FDD538F|nr:MULTISPECIES: hypothetical protein [Piscinibacter]MCW5665840.1 hypothetical protein [Piscinibacter sp.]
MDVAELYLSMTRPSAVPVVGECMADGFVGQIQIERWSWNLMNDEEIKRAKKDARDYEGHSEFLNNLGDPHDRQRQADRFALARKKLNDALEAQARASEPEDPESAATARAAEMKKYANKDEATRDKAMAEYDRRKGIERRNAQLEAFKNVERARIALKGVDKDLTRKDRDELERLDKMVGEAVSDAEKIERRLKAGNEAWEEQNKSYEFNFSKRVDFATTQMLNSMKAGDVFPLAVLTINQRSSNSGMVLVFTVTNLRLLDYSLRAEVSETMTDMKEQWKAEFRSLAYVYKNRKAIESSSDGAEAATKMATQGTVRTFAMKKDLGI